MALVDDRDQDSQSEMIDGTDDGLDSGVADDMGMVDTAAGESEEDTDDEGEGEGEGDDDASIVP